MINLHWLRLPMARTVFHGPKGVRAIEVRLYVVHLYNLAYTDHRYTLVPQFVTKSLPIHFILTPGHVEYELGVLIFSASAGFGPTTFSLHTERTNQ